MATSKEVREEAKRKLIEAVTEFAQSMVGVEPGTFNDFQLEPESPTIEYQRQIYADKIHIEIDMTRTPQ